MSAVNELLAKAKKNMSDVAEKLRKDLGTLRTGRANPQMLENVRVDYYGVPTPLKQMAVINTSDARTLEIQPWDITAIKDIEKALTQTDLGAAPVNDGKVIRISFPPMTEDRRKTLGKTVAKMSEDYKVTVRNERRDIIEKLKKAQKTGEITEDDCKRCEGDIQKATDAAIALIEKTVSEKEKEIMTV
ncbi:MAG: ribosome recycling factor [Elusimicrobiota bacterium]|jgi:ribosome recycling factor|nr:ribosome recycling factor [Elusimicrobiota bacterium]